MRHLILCGFLAALFASAPAYANAQNAEVCRAMSATFAPRQAEIDELTAIRDAAAVEAEEKGEAFEDLQVHRLVSATYAAAADKARGEFEAARKALARHEMALQATVRAFNEDTERFSRMCATEQ